MAILRLSVQAIAAAPVTTISFRLPERLMELPETESRARDTTKSSLVRECVEKALVVPRLGNKVTCYDFAHDLAEGGCGRVGRRL